MHNVLVSVAEVSVWPGDEVHPAWRVLVRAPDHELPTTAADPTRVHSAASSLLEEVEPFTLPGSESAATVLEPVSFSTVGGLTVLYTAAAKPAVPLLATVHSGQDDGDSAGTLEESRVGVPDGWRELAPTTADGPENLVLVRDYWRQQLEETTAVFDLLPRFFTTTQVREVYNALWGGPVMDPANFQRWLHSDSDTEPPRCRRASINDIREQRDARVAESVGRRLGLGTYLTGTSPAAMKAASSGVASPLAALLPAVPAMLVGAAVAGGTIAFQSRKQRGREPQWYTRAAPIRHRLQDPMRARLRYEPFVPSAGLD